MKFWNHMERVQIKVKLNSWYTEERSRRKLGRDGKPIMGQCEEFIYSGSKITKEGRRTNKIQGQLGQNGVNQRKALLTVNNIVTEIRKKFCNHMFGGTVEKRGQLRQKRKETEGLEMNVVL